jgi:hypothetical protein
LFQWADAESKHGEQFANTIILRIVLSHFVLNGGQIEFGKFYNALVYSGNRAAAELCRSAIDDNMIERKDGKELYKE